MTSQTPSDQTDIIDLDSIARAFIQSICTKLGKDPECYDVMRYYHNNLKYEGFDQSFEYKDMGSELVET